MLHVQKMQSQMFWKQVDVSTYNFIIFAGKDI